MIGEYIIPALAVLTFIWQVVTWLKTTNQRTAETGKTSAERTKISAERTKISAEGAESWQDAYGKLRAQFLQNEFKLEVVLKQNRLMKGALLSAGIDPKTLSGWPELPGD